MRPGVVFKRFEWWASTDSASSASKHSNKQAEEVWLLAETDALPALKIKLLLPSLLLTWL